MTEKYVSNIVSPGPDLTELIVTLMPYGCMDADHY